MSEAYDPRQDGAKMSFNKDMSYGDYLQIDRVIDSQRLLSTAHDAVSYTHLTLPTNREV